MSYDEGLAQRIRELLHAETGVEEKKMFGGLAFMVGGHMCVGVVDDRLMARVGPEQYRKALREPHAGKMDFTGKPLTGFVYVEPEGFEADLDLKRWVHRCRLFVESLPPK